MPIGRPIMRDGQYIDTVDYETVKISELIAMMVGRELGNIYPRREARTHQEAVLEVNGLTRKGVLNNIDFTLNRGEILGFAGLMGAGRTELARAIFGADPIDSGTIKLNGKAIVIKGISDAIAQGISYLTEDRKKRDWRLICPLSAILCWEITLNMPTVLVTLIRNAASKRVKSRSGRSESKRHTLNRRP